MSLKQQTISGLSWAFVSKLANNFIQFGIGIFLARLLTPAEYGLFGMTAMFLAISNVFVESGLSAALIRKKHTTVDDYSTIFIFNISAALFLYILLVLFSGYISSFFAEPLLKQIIIVLSLNLLISSLGFTPSVILTKALNFKTPAIISILSAVISGIIAICLAYKGFGVWSLVWRSIIQNVLIILMLFWVTRPKLKARFSIVSFKELFGFSSKIMITHVINEVYNNIYYAIIGKFFSARDLGIYTRAQQYNDLPSKTLNNTIQSVSYPVLAKIKDDPERLKSVSKKLIKSIMFISSTLMFGLAAVSDNFIIGLIGVKWIESVQYLQMLCFVGVLYPLHAMNLNLLNIKGRSDLSLKVEIIKKVLAIPTFVIGIFFGIKIMIIGMFIYSIIAYFINSYWSSRLINYPVKEQIFDMLPSLFLPFIMGIFVYFTGKILSVKPIVDLFIQIATGAFFIVIVSKFIKFKTYLELEKIMTEQYQRVVVYNMQIWKKKT